jgi:hypothetical protein
VQDNRASVRSARRAPKSRPASAPAGILLYLVVGGFVATVTIGVFFGIGLSVLVQPIEELIAGSGTNGPTPGSSVEAPSQSGATALPQADVAPQSENPITEAELVVAQWGFGHSLETARRQPLQGNGVRGRPIYLWMTLNGTQAAVDRMRLGSRLAIEVRWTPEDDNARASVAELTIGGPGVADALEQRVRGRGFFEWHSWTWRSALGAGTWTVSLNYPNGQPLLCGQHLQPCRFTINVG